MPADPRVPLVIFDGDCSFCRMWVDYWRSLTGQDVDYEPWQTAAVRFPEVPRADFQKAVHFFQNGKRYSGAEAAFQLNASVPGRSWLLWIYYRIPGFALIAQWAYRFIAAHRNAGYRVTRALWGRKIERPKYDIASSLFARAIALIYMIAFISFGRQVRGLIGSDGILPVTDFLIQVTAQFGSAARWVAPTLFWWTHSEFSLESIAWSGALLAGVAAIGRPHSSGQKAAFVVLFVYYLSIVTGGQVFTSYQWDFLLLETGFLAIFLKPASWTRLFLFRWLLFRLMFESGIVKLTSHDPNWRNLTALSYHYWTQPLPTPIAWYMAQAPLWFQKGSTVFLFAVELALPVLMFGPRRLKQIAAIGTIALQTLILFTGNYNFFNLLAIALCLFLFDDQALAWTRGKRPAKPRTGRFGPVKISRVNRQISLALFLFVMTVSLAGLVQMLGVELPGSVNAAMDRLGPFGLVNRYGLFATMTTARPEISIEGSNDGVNWQPYVFKYKAGPLNRPPAWVAPSQPRLDWQMWFAALENYRDNPWLLRFMLRLLQGSVPTLQLIDQNPFPTQPPKYVRAMLYEYRFTNFDERRQTGNWWKRELKRAYFPPVSLRASQQNASSDAH